MEFVFSIILQASKNEFFVLLTQPAFTRVPLFPITTATEADCGCWRINPGWLETVGLLLGKSEVQGLWYLMFLWQIYLRFKNLSGDLCNLAENFTSQIRAERIV